MMYAYIYIIYIFFGSWHVVAYAAANAPNSRLEGHPSIIRSDSVTILLYMHSAACGREMLRDLYMGVNRT